MTIWKLDREELPLHSDRGNDEVPNSCEGPNYVDDVRQQGARAVTGQGDEQMARLEEGTRMRRIIFWPEPGGFLTLGMR